jgi:hypothetical protein
MCKRNLIAARADFEAEQQLATVQISSKRHKEVIAHLTSNSSNGNHEPVTTVSTPRNIMFTGRERVLEDLHAKLRQSFAPTEVSQRKRCSCLIHGVGGMGKTETALEYIYRYRNCYSHIFWLRADSNGSILSSFLEISEKLGLEITSSDNQRKIRWTLDWFNSTCMFAGKYSVGFTNYG